MTSAEMPGRIESPSAQMGQLLLRGFAMLAAVCDDCQYPLMRDPQTMQSHCVACRRLFDADGNPQDQPQEPPAANGAIANGPISPGQPQANLAGGSSNTTTSSTARQPGSSTAAAAAAAAVANGPVVLTYAAHMQQQQQTHPQQQQQLLDQPDSDEERETAAIRRRLEQQRQQQAIEQQRRRAAAAAGTGGVQDPSQMLADRLLAGWAMLAQSCPICHTPLMRSRAGEIRCLPCDLPVVIERPTAAAATAAGTAAPAAAASTAASLPNGIAAAAAAAPSTPDSVVTAVDAGEQQQIPRVPVAQQQQQQGPAGLPAAPGSEQQRPGITQARAAGDFMMKDVCAGPANLLLHQQEVFQALQQTLLMKIDEARQQLLPTPVCQTEALSQQLTVTQQLMQAFEQVKQCMPR